MAGDRPGGPGWGHDADPLLVLRDGAEALPVAVPAGDYGGFYVAMRDAIRGSRQVPVSPVEAIRVMAMIAAGVESSAQARAVRTADVLEPSER